MVQITFRPSRLSDLGTDTSAEEMVVQPCWVLVVERSEMVRRCPTSPCSLVRVHWMLEAGLLSWLEQEKVPLSPAVTVSGPVRLTNSGPTEIIIM